MTASPELIPYLKFCIVCAILICFAVVAAFVLIATDAKQSGFPFIISDEEAQLVLGVLNGLGFFCCVIAVGLVFVFKTL